MVNIQVPIPASPEKLWYHMAPQCFRHVRVVFVRDTEFFPSITTASEPVAVILAFAAMTVDAVGRTSWCCILKPCDTIPTQPPNAERNHWKSGKSAAIV